MKVALIVAAAANNVIGKDNQMPWYLPDDLKYFKAKTLGKPIIMGRKTFESIGKALPGRTNIVVTKQSDWEAPQGVHVVNDLTRAIELAQASIQASDTAAEEIMVIGGAQIYRASLPLADRVYLTRIERDFEGDTCFPELLPEEWKVVVSTDGDPKSLISHKFLVFERID